MIANSAMLPWQYNYRFSRNDCDAKGNVLSSSMFRVAELAREKFFCDSVKGYSGLIEAGMKVLINESHFKFETEFLPFDKVTCCANAARVDKNEVVIRFQFLKPDTGQVHAEANQVLRFADSNRNTIDVPAQVTQALTPLLVNPITSSMPFKNMAAAGEVYDLTQPLQLPCKHMQNFSQFVADWNRNGFWMDGRRCLSPEQLPENGFAKCN